MKITDIKTTLISIPTTVPMAWSPGVTTSSSAVIVQIFTDEGIVGLGECVGPSPHVVKTIIDKELNHFLIGEDAFNIELLDHKMANACHWYKVANYAVAGIEMALLDIKGKALNTPLANLLGGYYREEAEFDGYLFIASPEANARDAAEFVQKHGFRQIKVKVGHDIDEDVKRVAAIRDAVGHDVKIRIDVNQEWSVSTSIRAINKMAKYDLQFVEQPTLFWDYEGMARIQAAVDVPIAAHESVMTPLDAIKCVEHNSCEIFIVDSSDSGGILKAKQIVDIANAAGKWCVMGTWIENGIASAANLHLICSSRNFPFANDTPWLLKADDIVKEKFEVKNGMVKALKAPGISVTLDEEKLKKYSASPATISRFSEEGLTEIPRYGKIVLT